MAMNFFVDRENSNFKDVAHKFTAAIEFRWGELYETLKEAGCEELTKLFENADGSVRVYDNMSYSDEINEEEEKLTLYGGGEFDCTHPVEIIIVLTKSQIERINQVIENSRATPNPPTKG